MKKEDVLTIIETLKKDNNTANIGSIEGLQAADIGKIVYYLRDRNVLKFTSEVIHLEDLGVATCVEFLPNSEEIIESLF